MKTQLSFIFLIITAVTHAAPLAEVNIPDGYDIGAFRKYSAMKNISSLGENSLRVFFMSQGRVSKAVEISLTSGHARLWPDWFEKSDPKAFTLNYRELSAITTSLIKKDLDAIPETVMPSSDGTCHLLEIMDEKGYYWRLHRNSSNGYFKAIANLVDLISLQIESK